MTNISLDPFDSSTWNDEERYYFETVDEVLESQENVIVSNGKPVHAVYLIYKFLTNAQESVRIYSGRLARKLGDPTESVVSVFDHPKILNAAKDFLRRGGKLTAIVEGDLDVDQRRSVEEHPLARVAREVEAQGELRGTLRISRAPEQAIEILREVDFNHHWMTMDQSAYRLETDTDQIKAHVNFGDPKMAGKLVELFDVLLNPESKELVTVGV